MQPRTQRFSGCPFVSREVGKGCWSSGPSREAGEGGREDEWGAFKPELGGREAESCKMPFPLIRQMCVALPTPLWLFLTLELITVDKLAESRGTFIDGGAIKSAMALKT